MHIYTSKYLVCLYIFHYLFSFVYTIDLHIISHSPYEIITQILNFPFTNQSKYFTSLYYIHNQTAYGPITGSRISSLNTSKLYPSVGDYRFYSNESLIILTSFIPTFHAGIPVSTLESSSMQYIYASYNYSANISKNTISPILKSHIYHSMIDHRGRLLQLTLTEANVPPMSHPYVIPQFDTMTITKAPEAHPSSSTATGNFPSNIPVTAIIISSLSIFLTLLLIVGLIMYNNYRRSQQTHSRYGTNPQGRGIQHMVDNTKKKWNEKIPELFSGLGGMKQSTVPPKEKNKETSTIPEKSSTGTSPQEPVGTPTTHIQLVHHSSEENQEGK